ncbi:hypothetical protein [Sorangium sp. So ce590]|uniref:hypothetical protein n=1 Tax=unclassified Sorangium TaxID=2621164 RepID=UPI003F646342
MRRTIAKALSLPPAAVATYLLVRSLPLHSGAFTAGPLKCRLSGRPAALLALLRPGDRHALVRLLALLFRHGNLLSPERSASAVPRHQREATRCTASGRDASRCARPRRARRDVAESPQEPASRGERARESLEESAIATARLPHDLHEALEAVRLLGRSSGSC